MAPYFVLPYCHWSVSVVDLLIFHGTCVRTGRDGSSPYTTLADMRESSDLNNPEAHYSTSLNDSVPYMQ